MKKSDAPMALVQLGISSNALAQAAPETLRELLMACHTRIRRYARLAFTLGARRELPAAEVKDAAKQCLRYFTEALPLHVRDEEDSISPRLTGHSAGLDAILARLRTEHASHQAHIQALLDALQAVIERPNQAVLHRQLARAAGTLETDFEEHLRVEEEELFPLMEQVLPAAAQAQIILELRARRAS